MHPAPTSPTYRDFLNLLRQNPQFGTDEFAFYLEEADRMSTTMVLPVHAVFILNFQSRGYPYINKNVRDVMGHPHAAFTEGGLEFMLHYRKDFEIQNTILFPDEISFLREHTVTNSFQVRFTKTFRFTSETGQIRTILQQNTIVQPPGYTLPLGIFGFTQDITPYAEKGKIVHQIDHFDAGSGGWIRMLSKEYYPDMPAEKLLSSREIEILKWAIEGHGSKQIADRLHLSVHTVNTHRRNMLRKTNSRNMMELLRFAVELKLL